MRIHELQINELSTFAYWYFVFFIGIIGLCVGSFANVVILRGLSGESIVFPPSKCPKCSNKLKWYHNIPVFSYIFLKGKCAFCKEKISIQYPIVELLSAFLFVYTFINYGLTLTTLFTCIMLVMFLIMSMTDLKEQVILTHHAYFLVGIALIYNFLNKEFLLPILGIIVGFGLMEAIARAGELLFGKRAFGEGDSYIGAAIGAIIGWKMFLYSLILAVVIQTFLILPIFIFKLVKTKQYSLLASLLIFALSAVSLLPLKGNISVVYYIILALLFISAFITIKLIFANIKKAQIETIPFGPAMLVGAFIIMFFYNNLAVLIK